MKQLTNVEQAQLAALIPTEGFQILNRLMKEEVSKFNVSLLNAKKSEDVLIAHNLAKAAAMFYQGIINRINAEVDEYKNVPKPGDVPIDPTEAVLLLQDFAQEE